MAPNGDVHPSVSDRMNAPLLKEEWVEPILVGTGFGLPISPDNAQVRCAHPHGSATIGSHPTTCAADACAPI